MLETTQSLLKVSEVAKVFGVHERTIDKWVREGRLDTVRPAPGTVRIPLDSVMELIERTRDRIPPVA